MKVPIDESLVKQVVPKQHDCVNNKITDNDSYTRSYKKEVQSFMAWLIKNYCVMSMKQKNPNNEIAESDIPPDSNL